MITTIKTILDMEFYFDSISKDIVVIAYILVDFS